MTPTFTNMDLSNLRGLSGAHIYPPINIDARTLLRSGVLPRDLYRAGGVSAQFEKSLKRIVQSKTKTVRCFISYSTRDEKFVKQLKSDLEQNGVETWYAPRDLAIGATIRDTLDKEILSVDRLIVVLSKTAIISSWVQQELETALEREKSIEGICAPSNTDR